MPRRFGSKGLRVRRLRSSGMRLLGRKRPASHMSYRYKRIGVRRVHRRRY